jgi:3-oxoadipate CoA-transferase, beta subunit
VTVGLSREEMAREVALDLPEGAVVNLGIGHPTQVARFVPAGREVVFHSENGVFGVGPEAEPGAEDWDLVDAGKHPVTLVAGGSFVSHADSFAAIRGGHIDIAVMGAFEVSVGGDLANWTLGEGLPAVGGAMDLVAGAKQVWALCDHTTKDGRPKLVGECSLPLTGRAVVQRVYTNLGCFEIGPDRFVAVGLVGGVDLSDVAAHTGGPVVLGDNCARLPRA